MARPPKPKHLKILAGTNQPCRDRQALVDYDPLVGIPPPLKWLPNIHAKNEWKRLCEILIPNNLLAQADLSTLGHLCALHGKIVQKYQAGTAPSASEAMTLRAMQSDFGLSAVARAKAKPVQTDKKQNKFSNHGSPSPKGA